MASRFLAFIRSSKGIYNLRVMINVLKIQFELMSSDNFQMFQHRDPAGPHPRSAQAIRWVSSLFQGCLSTPVAQPLPLKLFKCERRLEITYCILPKQTEFINCCLLFKIRRKTFVISSFFPLFPKELIK